jgi:hypothetical protein
MDVRQVMIGCSHPLLDYMIVTFRFGYVSLRIGKVDSHIEFVLQRFDHDGEKLGIAMLTHFTYHTILHYAIEKGVLLHTVYKYSCLLACDAVMLHLCSRTD